MASNEEMTEYERRRLENIKRNFEMLSYLNVHARLSDISNSSKRHREEKIYKKTLEKIKKSETPVLSRRSLRNQGIPPDSYGLPKNFNDSRVSALESKTKKLSYSSKPHPIVDGPLSMKDAYAMEEGSYRAIVEKFTNITKSQSDDEGQRRTRSIPKGESRLRSKVETLERVNLEEAIDVNSLNLEPENIARVLPPGKPLSVRFIPTTYMTMVVAGNEHGHLGFWDVKPQKEDGDVIHLYQPHTAPVSGICVHPFSLSKLYTSSYDGFIRLMDIEREEFDLVYSSSRSSVYSLSLQPNDANSVYLGEGEGDLNVLDVRVQELTNSWSLHGRRINTIDFNPANPNIMATSSSDGLACLWDLRKLDVKHPERSAFQTLNHGRAVHSAYLSPSGSSMATTSVDNNVGVLYGVNFEDNFMIPHENSSGQCTSFFRAMWGWDDTHLFVGNMKRKVDILSVKQKKTIKTLESPLISATPCRYDAHPCKVGMLAGATNGGQIYIWTASL